MNSLLFTLILFTVSGAFSQEISFDAPRDKTTAGIINTIGSSAQSLPAPPPGLDAKAGISKEAGGQQKDWTVMIFISGRNDLSPYLRQDIKEIYGAQKYSDNINIVTEYGSKKETGNSARIAIQNGKISRQTVRYSDTGSWKQLRDFAKETISGFPAKRYMLIISGHGTGRIDYGGNDNSGAELGTSYDYYTRNFIRNSQLRTALSAIGAKIDILVFDACLMQTAEVAYELKDYADFITASEELMPSNGFHYTGLLNAINSLSKKSTKETAGNLIKTFYAYYSAFPPETLYAKGSAFSAVQTSALPDFIRKLNAWIKEAYSSGNSQKIKAAAELAFGFPNSKPWRERESKDLYHFVELAAKSAAKDSPLYAESGKLLNFMKNELITANKTTGKENGFADAYGLAVYMPAMIYDPSYDELSFAEASYWDDFIKWLLDPDYKIRW